MTFWITSFVEAGNDDNGSEGERLNGAGVGNGGEGEVVQYSPDGLHQQSYQLIHGVNVGEFGVTPEPP